MLGDDSGVRRHNFSGEDAVRLEARDGLILQLNSALGGQRVEDAVTVEGAEESLLVGRVTTERWRQVTGRAGKLGVDRAESLLRIPLLGERNKPGVEHGGF